MPFGTGSEAQWYVCGTRPFVAKPDLPSRASGVSPSGRAVDVTDMLGSSRALGRDPADACGRIRSSVTAPTRSDPDESFVAKAQRRRHDVARTNAIVRKSRPFRPCEVAAS